MENFIQPKLKAFGKQRLRRVTFKPYIENNWYRGPINLRLSYDVTFGHRWILADNSETCVLNFRDKVKAKAVAEGIDFESQSYCNGYAHGMVFGNETQYPEQQTIRLCNDPKHENLEQTYQLLMV